MRTEALFREDAYLGEAEARVVAVNDRGGILLDRTIFYATSGGQPGDTGRLLRADGGEIAVAATVTGETKDEIIHVPAEGCAIPGVGETLKLAIDWQRRLKLMRMHTACHLLTVVCPFPITGAAVAEEDSRVDFDIPDAGWTRDDVTARMMELVKADHPVFTRLITDEELAANPALVKSKNVRRGSAGLAAGCELPGFETAGFEPADFGSAGFGSAARSMGASRAPATSVAGRRRMKYMARSWRSARNFNAARIIVAGRGRIVRRYVPFTRPQGVNSRRRNRRQDNVNPQRQHLRSPS